MEAYTRAEARPRLRVRIANVGFYDHRIKEQIVFPEIDYDKIDAIRGLNVTFTTSAPTDEEGRALLGAFNFPFRAN